jgi:ATP/ADP translocase
VNVTYLNPRPVPVPQAKRMYSMISLVGNLGPIFSGLTMSVVSKAVRRWGPTSDEAAFEASLKVLSALMAVAGGLVCALHWWTMQLHLRQAQYPDPHRDHSSATTNAAVVIGAKTEVESGSIGGTAAATSDTTARTPAAGAQSTATTPPMNKNKTVKPKLNFVQSLQVLFSSPYLRNIATMVVSYGLTMEFTEIIWKSAVKKAFPVKTDYLQFMGRYSTLVGLAAFGMMFAGTQTVQVLGWRAGALLTPLVMGLLAAPFFWSVFVGEGPAQRRSLLAAVYIGLAQNVLSKAAKYSVFDPTKEMAYIPLDTESKSKGKAAIDVLGARVGKSGGALAQQLLVLMFGSITEGGSLLVVLFYAAIYSWIRKSCS